MAFKLNLTSERIRTLDKSDLLGKTLELPEQIRTGLDLGTTFVRSHALPRLEEIDWIGLGGSAVAGDLLQGFGLEPPDFPLRINVLRYPRVSSARRLVCSYSGDTVESVRAFEEVPPSQVWFAMSSGGKLETLAKQAAVPHLKVPSGYPPRAAVGFALGAMIAIFDGLYSTHAADNFRTALSALTSDVNSYRNLVLETNPALELAVKLVDRVPVIYVADGLAMPGQAVRFRAQLAENSKVWSHAAPLPEMAHNEVESFAFLGQVLPPPLVIFLGSWKFDGVFNDPRPGMRNLLDSLQIAHITLDPAEIWGSGLSRLDAGLRLMQRLDAATVFLALLKALDPTEIPVITKLKKGVSHA